MKTITVKMDENLVERLDGLAEEEHITRSEFIRTAINEYIEQEERIGEATSVYEAAKDIIGCAEGPEDLSTNPKYMEGYGE